MVRMSNTNKHSHLLCHLQLTVLVMHACWRGEDAANVSFCYERISFKDQDHNDGLGITEEKSN